MIHAPAERWISRSPHASVRRVPVSAIVIHTTGADAVQSTLDWFARSSSRVSAHVVIDRNGYIYRVVPDDLCAWHAGRSVLDGVPRVNDYSLGAELVGKGGAGTYPEAQIQAALSWCASRCQAYEIPVSRVVGHADVCVPPGRKLDPVGFPWSTFRARLVTMLEADRA